MSTEFEPIIIAYACNWCAYSAADLAGVSRRQYPPNLRIIRLMCSGRVNSNFLLKAFELGADGVMVAGWHLGDCHYQDGNVKAEKVCDMVRELMALLGLNQERLRLVRVSSAEGLKFAETVEEFTSLIKKLGPLGLRQAA